MMLWMVVFWVGVVLLAIWLAGRLFSGVPQSAPQSPREILKARCARGEITREQYEEMLKVLSEQCGWLTEY